MPKKIFFIVYGVDLEPISDMLDNEIEQGQLMKLLTGGVDIFSNDEKTFLGVPLHMGKMENPVIPKEMFEVPHTQYDYIIAGILNDFGITNIKDFPCNFYLCYG